MNTLQGLTPDWLRQRAYLSPQRLAVLSEEGSFNYQQLDAAVDLMAGRLRSEGVSPGELVALLARNSVAYVAAVHAVARLGAVLLPLNARLTPAEMAWQLKDAGVHRLITDEAHRDAAIAVRNEVSPLALITLDSASIQDSVSPSAATVQEAFDLAALHTVLYTSGTTGRPKGAMLSFGNHLWSATASALNLGLRPDDRWLACLPLFHAGGLSILLRSVIYGTAAVVHAGFDPARANASIDSDGVTMISVVANMLQRMLDDRGDRPYPASLRCVLLGGGPAPETLLRRCAEIGVPVVQTYGLTETASQVSTLAPEDALRKLGSAGKPLFGSELRIVTDEGAGCAAGEAGQIVVRGPTVSRGYLNHPGETASLLKDGWLHTGDIGYLDEEGYLYVLDRRDDLIVSGGENVYPAEVESVLQAHPAVLEAGVYGVQDEKWGRVPVAAVVLKTEASATAEELIAFCRERLAGYKTPSRIEFREALPRNAAGKLLRTRLAQAGLS
jgi:O-succinylbenzoic acid--CoA ligase